MNIPHKEKMNKGEHKILFKKFNHPWTEKIKNHVQSLSPIEKLILGVLTVTVIFSALSIIMQLNREVSTVIPTHGGTITEGVTGAPRFINPLLAPSDTDRDMTSLIYAGLMRPAIHGGLIPDLAKDYTISDDGRVYTFTLKDDLYFQDGIPLTADDILFTIKTAQNPAIRSTRRADWDGVKVEKLSKTKIRFTLKVPYAPFLENTTIGILPKHLWKNVSPQDFAFSTFNTQPVGSGPFLLKKITYSSTGIPTQYELRAFRKYALGRPFINKIVMKFYSNNSDLIDAYKNGAITNVSALSSSLIKESTLSNSKLLRITFPRIFAVFFNQNKKRIFADIKVREALNVLIDKQKVIDVVLNGYGTAIDSPLPPNTVSAQNKYIPKQRTQKERIDLAKKILTDGGWKFDTEQKLWMNKKGLKLAFSISTTNAPELKLAAETVVGFWAQAGIPVKIKIFETGDLNQNVLRSRDYEALLFGEIIGRGLDLFAFWDSSQKDDPGLNIAGYTNSKVDSILEKARTISDKRERDALYRRFENEIMKDTPALFLYAPDFLYIIPKNLYGVTINLVSKPSERFSEIQRWYQKTERVWYFFLKD